MRIKPGIVLLTLIAMILTSTAGAIAEAQPGERMTISIANIDDGAYEGDPLIELVEDKLNIDIEFVPLSWSNFVEKANVMIASDSHPDSTMTLGWNNPSAIIKWYNQGAIRALPEDLSQWPRLKAQIEQFPEQVYDGQRIVITRAANIDPAMRYADNSLYYRKDLFEKYSIEAPSTMEEYLERGKALQAALKADGKNVYLLSANKDQTFYYHFITPYGLNPEGFIQETQGEYAGKWIPATLSPTYWKALEFAQRLYQEKLLDPEFASISEDEKVDKFVNGKALSIYQNGIFGWYKLIQARWNKANPGVDFAQYCTIINEFESPVDGKRYDARNPNFWAGQVINANVDDAKMARILDLCEFLLSDEGLELSRYGREGIDFVKQDGKYISLLPKNEDGTEQLAKTYYRLHNLCVTVNWGDDYHTDSTDPVYPAWHEGNFLPKIANTILEPGLSYVRGDVIDEVDIYAPAREIAVKFIMSDMTAEDALKEYTNRLRNECQLDAYLEDLQAFAASNG